jgi:hypothetical protein
MTMHQHFAGTLTARDAKRHLPHRFVVPEGCVRVEIALRFALGRVEQTTNMLTLTLFDAAGFRGAGHRGGAEHIVQLTPTSATPGYHRGPLPPGEWNAQIDTHMIMPGEPVRYTLDVRTEVGPQVELPAPRPPATAVPGRGPGWYRGDLHSHTVHSDASQTVEELLQAARRHRLDFLFLTDHNTTSPLPEMDAANSPDLLTAGGLELTTFWGHAVVLGTRHWIDWCIRPGGGAIAQIANEVAAAGHLFIIAHPLSPGDPRCTGCAWRFPELMPGVARQVEIWNGPWSGDSNNPLALALWYDWLNQGWRLVATAGTDTHSATDYDQRPGFNVVYAEALTEAALLRAISAGHLYLSAGPTLTFAAQAADGQRWMMGDTVDQPATLTLGWQDCPAGAEARLIANGRLWKSWPCDGQGERQWPVAPEAAEWCVLEIRDADGAMLAISNPIYFAP